MSGSGDATQILVEFAIADQFLHMGDALESLPFKLLERQPGSAISVVELLHAASRRPLGFECVQASGDIVTVDAIASRIWPRVEREFDPAIGNDRLHDIGDFSDLVVFCRQANIERLVVDKVAIGLEGGDIGSSDVFDVHDRPPRRYHRS